MLPFNLPGFVRMGYLAVAAWLMVAAAASAEPKLTALILDGQNNHDWRATTPIMKAALEASGLFKVDVATSPSGKDLSSYKPEFAKYSVVVSNYNGGRWPTETEAALLDYVKKGGGFVVVHAANNSFGDWKEYNEMIGLGGWGGRTEKSGPYVYADAGGKIVRDTKAGRGGNHGSQHAFQIIVRDGDHPITKGMPKSWMHEKDELYDQLRGPAENMTVLATAYADPKQGGTGRHEPMIFTIDFGKGRVLHTPMGHADYSMKCTGFITTLIRGAQWAATGKVTTDIPADFPTADKFQSRDPAKPAPKKSAATDKKPPHVVFLTGDEEYRGEESMPMLAKILNRDYGFQVTVGYSLAADGTIDPNNVNSVTNTEALATADMLVMFMRFRKLPDEQLKYILDYADSGKPLAGFRTATHSFRYGSGPHAKTMDEAWTRNVFGQRWITHHGHFGDGNERLTDVALDDATKDHPILRGVKPFQAYSWLYHVEGGGDKLAGQCQSVAIGKALKTSHKNELDRFPLTNPVAWTKTHTGKSGKSARVFFTTLGHPYDFKEESMRKLALNGILWSMGLEDKIPTDGASAKPVGDYNPTNSGFGDKFKKGVKPERIGEDGPAKS